MKSHWVITAGAGLVSLGILAGLGAPRLQPDKKQPDKAPAKPAAPAGDVPDMKAPMDPNAAPGEMHKRLTRLAGNWDSTTTFSIGGEAMPESNGTARITSLLGGRFINIDSMGQMMGQKFNSIQVVGYNNAAQKFESTWIYDMGTSMMIMQGPASADGKSATLDAVSNERPGEPEKLKVTYTWVDDDHFTVTLAGDDAQSPPAVMTIKHTRKK